jgi:hypothetical protein
MGILLIKNVGLMCNVQENDQVQVFILMNGNSLK